jgi:dipeptidyl aminopeptidase/acylaminoacyl peptidase
MTVMTTTVPTLHPARKGPRPITAEDMWRIPRVGAPVPAPDGTWLVVPVTTYDLETNESRTRLWRVPADGGEPRAITSAELSGGEPAISPDGRQLAFTRRIEKGKAQLHVIPLDGGEARKLTDLPLGAFDPKWLPDGSGIVFGAQLFKGHPTPEATKTEFERREKDPVKAHVTEERFYRYWDTWLTTGEVVHLFVIDLASGTIRDLTPESEFWFDWMEPRGRFDIAPDGSEVAFEGIDFDHERSLIRSRIYRAPVAGGATECLTSSGTGQEAQPRYSPDGKFLVYGQQHDPFFYADRVRIMALDRASGTHAEWIGSWDLSPAHWTFGRDGTLLLEAEHEARMHLWAFKPGDREPRRYAAGGTLGGATAASDGRVWCMAQSLVQPPEIACVEPGGGEPRIVTRFTADTCAQFGTSEVRELQFEGAHGETVQMFVLLPPGYEPGKKYPLVQVIHGGPHAISGDVFHFRWSPQVFASPGYVVALVNFQGSTSWGQDFAKRIQGGWGERPFEDVMKATDVLAASDFVDATRMAAAGGSYGGYMAAWIEGNTNRFRCIVNHAGVYDLLVQYASDVTQGRAQSMGGEAWDGLERIQRWNPATTARGFETPMLVLHGEKDYRVPVSHGLECYGVLKAKGVPARLVYFPDENHWVLKPKNSLLWYREVLGWLERWLSA